MLQIQYDFVTLTITRKNRQRHCRQQSQVIIKNIYKTKILNKKHSTIVEIFMRGFKCKFVKNCLFFVLFVKA